MEEINYKFGDKLNDFLSLSEKDRILIQEVLNIHNDDYVSQIKIDDVTGEITMLDDRLNHGLEEKYSGASDVERLIDGKKGILFCDNLGIVRAPLAKYIMQDLLCKLGMENDFFVDAVAIGKDNVGHRMAPYTLQALCDRRIHCIEYTVKNIDDIDYDDYQYIIGFTIEHLLYMSAIFQRNPKKKMSRLGSYLDAVGDILSPSNTDEYEKLYRQIYLGCIGFLSNLGYYPDEVIDEME